MRLVLFALLALASPSVAEASGCYVGPFVGAAELPLGCPLVVYDNALVSSTAPSVVAYRDGQLVDVTGDTTREQTQLFVGYPEYECDGTIGETTYQSEPYDVYRVTVKDTFVGDQVMFGGQTIRIVDAGACVEPVAPQPFCGHLPPTCDPPDDDAGGCSTGAPGAGAALAFAALLAARRRRVRMRAR